MVQIFKADQPDPALRCKLSGAPPDWSRGILSLAGLKQQHEVYEVKNV